MSLDPIICTACGILFEVPKDWYKTRRRDGRNFYCPNGHSLSYRDDTYDIVVRERDWLKQKLAEKDDEIRDWKATLAAQVAEKKRLLKRTHTGVCIHCKRSFANMARHMKTKHADKFTAEVVA